MILPPVALGVPVQTSEEEYRALQARLARYATVRLVAYSGNGNAWDHDWECGYVPPNKGYATGTMRGFRANGRLTWSAEGSLIGRSDGLTHPALPNDVAANIGLPGFESFYAPGTRVSGSSSVRETELPPSNSPALALDLTLDGRRTSLFLDPNTLLPEGALESAHRYVYYSKVELGFRFAPDAFRVPQRGGRP